MDKTFQITDWICLVDLTSQQNLTTTNMTFLQQETKQNNMKIVYLGGKLGLLLVNGSPHLPQEWKL